MADLVTLDEVLSHLNMADNPPADLTELELFIDAATAHVEQWFGTFPSGTYTEVMRVRNDRYGLYQNWFRPLHWPVTAVTSVTSEDGLTSHTTGIVISADSRAIRHDYVTLGDWTVVYTAGQAVPADLKLCVLEDIRGLYQPSQIGPPATFGSFDIDTGPATTFRPVTQWPRTDAWVQSRLGSQIA